MKSLQRAEVLGSFAVLMIFGTVFGSLFAQKADKDPGAEDLKRAKSLSTAIIIYEVDADDRAPIAFALSPNGYRSSIASLPSGWRGDAGEEIVRADGVHWSNAIYPYVKTRDYYASVRAPETEALSNGTPAKQPFKAIFNFNGLMSEADASTIASPAEAYLITEASGFVNVSGVGRSNPALICRGQEPCRYVPSQANCTIGLDGSTSSLTALDAKQADPDGEQVLSFTDGHAKRVKVVDRPIWSALRSDGSAIKYWADKFGCHPLQFRPDYEATDVSSRTERNRD